MLAQKNSEEALKKTYKTIAPLDSTTFQYP